MKVGGSVEVEVVSVSVAVAVAVSVLAVAVSAVGGRSTRSSIKQVKNSRSTVRWADLVKVLRRSE